MVSSCVQCGHVHVYMYNSLSKIYQLWPAAVCIVHCVCVCACVHPYADVGLYLFYAAAVCVCVWLWTAVLQQVMILGARQTVSQ